MLITLYKVQKATFCTLKAAKMTLSGGQHSTQQNRLFFEIIYQSYRLKLSPLVDLLRPKMIANSVLNNSENNFRRVHKTARPENDSYNHLRRPTFYLQF